MLAALAAATFPAFAGSNGIDCRCLYQGRYFEQGETVCIRVDGRARLARCGMLLNNSAWKFLSDGPGCPSASMTPVPAIAPPGGSGQGGPFALL